MAKIMIIAGGTGGHIFPGIAVAEALAEKGHEILWMGTNNGLETTLLPRSSLYTIDFAGIRKKGIKPLLTLPVALSRAILQASRILKKAKPDLVLGMGGYTSFPGGVAAFLKGIPLVIHEQNSVAGFANRALALVARKTLLGFPETLKRGLWFGNPARHTIYPTDRSSRQGPLRILILGGSQGAKALNEVVPKALALLKTPFLIRHQCGRTYEENTKHFYQDLHLDAEVVPFLEKIEESYAWCDLAICRSGAMTLTELAQAAVPAILVPYPYAVDDHQTKNALFYVQTGGALLMPEKDLTPKALAAILADLDREKLHTMARQMQRNAKADAAIAIVSAIMEIVDAP